MSGSSLLALIDDIATILDDVALMTKVAAKKTTGVPGDDLALNAEPVSGVQADRELPVVWAVAKGSAKNKLILVPAALLISAMAPWLITPLLMLGGAYLCFEGFEKTAHRLLHSPAEDKLYHDEQLRALGQPDIDMVIFEQTKIKGAIRTDFILSAEIIIIALGTVNTVPLATQALVAAFIAVLMTIGVYGLVAGIVKLDDAGFYLLKARTATTWDGFQRACGKAILAFAPFLMKSLATIGTIAMFIVGGGILAHGIPNAGAFFHHAQQQVMHIPAVGDIAALLIPTLLNILAGIAVGGLLLLLVVIGKNIHHHIKPA